MLRSRDTTKSPSATVIVEDDSKPTASKFTVAGMVAAILFIVVVLYVVFSDTSKYHSDSDQPQSKRSLTRMPPSAATRKFLREPSRTLGDLSPMDASKLQRLIHRQDKLSPLQNRILGGMLSGPGRNPFNNLKRLNAQLEIGGILHCIYYMVSIQLYCCYPT